VAPDRRPGTRSRGFTLLEAVVALLIVSLGMIAVMTQLGQFASSASYLQDKTLASWIASNRLTELSLQSSWPELGDSEDDIEFAGRDWHYRAEVSATDVENLRRVDVEVALADAPERILHTVSALLEPPLPPGFVAVRWGSVGNPDRRGTPGSGGEQVPDGGGTEVREVVDTEGGG